ncbi:MAG TPA: hypothetical protein O0X23_04480, partial [Methanocorpusculum sp.]|nr:hypothetical protein [Methanocorpusculum sp.]
MGLVSNSQCFPLYSYESGSPAGRKGRSASQATLSGNEPQKMNYTRKDGVSDFILHEARTHYADPTITKEDKFYYVYGILHSREYRATFSADLKKVLVRIP